MPRPLDVTGKVFGRLTAKECVGSSGDGRIWLCQCECGAQARIMLERLTAGITRSCGCLRSQEAKRTVKVAQAAKTTHGLSKSSEMCVWAGMISRCTKPERRAYESYGARGIVVCDRWRLGADGKTGFATFVADMGRRPSLAHEIERVDNNGNYEPANCKWATRKEQMNNTRRSRFVTIRGETKTMTQWCEQFSIPTSTVRHRMRIGLSAEDALSRPRYSFKGTFPP